MRASLRWEKALGGGLPRPAAQQIEDIGLVDAEEIIDLDLFPAALFHYGGNLPEFKRSHLPSGVVPELVMRDMISLRFSGVKTSAIAPRPRLAVQLLPPAGMRHRGILDRNEYTSRTFRCTPRYIADDGLCQQRPRTP